MKKSVVVCIIIVCIRCDIEQVRKQLHRHVVQKAWVMTFRLRPSW